MGRGGYRGGSRSGSRGRSSHSGGHGLGRSYSSKTRSFVSGKIAGQYRAKGYSKSRAQHIGNSVVSKMRGTFKSGRGSRFSYRAGLIAGRNQSRYGIARATHIGNATVYGPSKKNRFYSGQKHSIQSNQLNHADNKRIPYDTLEGGESNNALRTNRTKYSRGYGKEYGAGYSRGYK